MLDTRIVLSGLWAATMLTFLWGDVLGSISGHTEPGKIGDSIFEPTHAAWVGIAALMLSPIIMIVLNLTVNHQAIRWVNLIIAGLWIIFNLGSLSGYPPYNKFLLLVSVVFNLITIWFAWKWEI
jgi:hypothetical protein